MDKNRITVKISIDSNIDKVWEYWTIPEHITNWNFATNEWCCPKAENDLQPTGKFSWRMEAKDGRNVDVEFKVSENQIQVAETFDAEGTHSDELQRTGWQAILGNFKNYVEGK